MNKEILQKGYVEVRVRVSGILQRHRLTVQYEDTNFGKVPYLVTKINIPSMELLRIANELQFPIKTPQETVFPEGKSPEDFTISQKETDKPQSKSG